ncbi:MAG: rRNA maturation RNase YbeY [Planctomycetota bacterium]
MSRIAVRIEEPMVGVSESGIRKAVAYTLQQESADLNLSVAVVDDAKIRELNLRYLNHDFATDVISFDLRNHEAKSDADVEIDLEGKSESEREEHWDAEIVVSATTAQREAALRGLDPCSELFLYCVHGTLHLLGYDDHDEQDQRRMHQRQAEILRGLGFETQS